MARLIPSHSIYPNSTSTKLSHTTFEQKDSDNLLKEDLIEAAKTYLAPIAPAIKALNSGEPALISAYEDMIGDEGFWDAFWNSVNL